MKKLFAIIGITTMLLLTGCASEGERNDKLIENKKKEIQELDSKISTLKLEESQLHNSITEQKVDNGTAKYLITLKIKQSHFTLDIGKHIKDAINDVDIQIPVDKEFYDSIEEGDKLDDSFRFGSFLMEGSVGSWDIKVINKEIK